MQVIFEGAGPFHLPVTQRATANAAEDVVEMTLYAIAPAQGPEPVPIRTAMTFGVAQALAAQLTKAAVEAEGTTFIRALARSFTSRELT